MAPHCRLLVALPLLLLLLLLRLELGQALVTTMSSKPMCEFEGGRVTLERSAGMDEAAVHALSQRLHEALTAWAEAPGGCRGEVVFAGADHCGQTYELPGAYHFHGHDASLNLASSDCSLAIATATATVVPRASIDIKETKMAKEAGTGQTTPESCSGGSMGEKTRVASLHSAHGVHLFRFTGGASIRARGIGFQGGTGKWGGAIELSGEGPLSDSDFDGCLFDRNMAASSGGAVIVEGAIDPETAEPTTARFRDCLFTHNSALQGGALFISPTTPGRARVELEGCVFEGNEAFDDGGAIYVAGNLVLKGQGNRFSGNQAGHHDADLYVDEALGGRVLHEHEHEDR